MGEIADLLAVMIAGWVGYQLGRSDECADWCKRQLKDQKDNEA